MQNRIKDGLRYLSITILSLAMIFPLFWMFMSALKTPSEIMSKDFIFFPAVPQWSNFIEAFELAPFHVYIWNSLFTSLIILVLQLLLSSMYAYALTQLEFKGKGFMFMLVLVTYMLPAAATYVPSYVILARTGLLNSFAGLILSSAASVSTIFLLRQNFKQIPKELIEAGRVIGASEWSIYTKIVLPYSKSAIFTAGLISFVGNYNSYLWPTLVLSDKNKQLITVGLNSFFSSQGTFASQWPLIMAASAISVVPLLIIFAVFQRYLITGISGGGVKG